MRNPLDRSPRTPDEPHIESFVQTRWHQLTDEERVQHTLGNSELYKQVKIFEQFFKNIG